MTSPKERLLALLKKDGTCLVYTGRLNNHGAAVFDTERGRTTTAQRAYLNLVMDTPLNRDVRVIVTCDNPRCVKHLFVPVVKTCKNGHPLGADTSYRDSKGHLRCRTCRRNQNRSAR